MRSVVFAYQEVGYVCLEELLRTGDEICAVFTHDDDPNEMVWFRSVRRLAEAHEIPVFSPERIDGGCCERIRAYSPDFVFSFYYRRLLPAPALAAARLGALNLHGSLLPKYRGRCPVNWALVHGETETGVTLHYMEEKPDRGDIVAQRRVPVTDDDSVATLYRKLTAVAAELLRETYPMLRAGTAPRIPQDHSVATCFGGRKPADGRIDWSRPARDIHNLVRAVTHPYPGAFCFLRGEPLVVWESRVEAKERGEEAAPGTVTAVDDGIVVRAGDGRLRARRVQLGSGPELSGVDFARQHAVTKGTVLT